MLYQVDTKVFNQAVKRNIERFPEKFRFQLTKEEYVSLRSQFVTSKGKGGRRYMPYVFTEQTGVFHDRFLIIDDICAYHIGASIKDAGKKCFGINLIKDERIVKDILERLNLESVRDVKLKESSE